MRCTMSCISYRGIFFFFRLSGLQWWFKRIKKNHYFTLKNTWWNPDRSWMTSISLKPSRWIHQKIFKFFFSESRDESLTSFFRSCIYLKRQIHTFNVNHEGWNCIIPRPLSLFSLLRLFLLLFLPPCAYCAYYLSSSGYSWVEVNPLFSTYNNITCVFYILQMRFTSSIYAENFLSPYILYMYIYIEKPKLLWLNFNRDISCICIF